MLVDTTIYVHGTPMIRIKNDIKTLGCQCSLDWKLL